ASTRPEPFGRTIAEAMACGRAVIVSAAGGAVELFEDGVSAVGVRPGDAVGLAEQIAALARDRDRRTGLGQRARDTAVKRFDRATMGRSIFRLYRAMRSGIR
ncbi:MAG: glycosyltransferase, partial [Tepidisphaeraceae bacterium]